MKAKLTLIILGTLIFVIPVGAFAFYKFYQIKFQPLPIYGRTKGNNSQKVDHTIPDFQLTNQNGVIVTTDGLKGRIVVADFFFTSCPMICPKMTKSLKKVQETFRDNQNLLITSFTIDPKRDDPERLKNYTKRFSVATDNWHFLTGEKQEIYKLARNGFMIVATDGDGGPDDFIHSEKLVLIDKHRRIRGYYDGTNANEVNTLIHDIKKLQHEN